MPLLRKKPFEKSSSCDTLDDAEEVFHCEITDEIFKDYDEYCERIILVNSMVWSCEMTGKPNLTYAEALDSEKKARKSLRDFPMELRVPMLYLASRTKRCNFAEMTDDVFNFVRDRYFVGETVEACLNSDVWAESHILSVMAPKHNNAFSSELSITFTTPASYCTYEIEQFDDLEDGAIQGEIAMVSHDRIRRPRGVFTREKNKLYLKQFVEQGPGGVIQVKPTILQKYNIAKVRFEQIFTGNPPDFPSSKKFDKFVVNGMMGKNKSNPPQFKKMAPDKKSRQETMSKYITKSDKFEGTTQSKTMETYNGKTNHVWKSNNISDKPLKDEMLRVGNAMKEKKKEEKLKKKEKTLMLAAYVKEWSKQKDDLELEDHKPLPKLIPVDIPGIPNKYFGDVMGMLEFFLEFSKPIKAKDYFLHGIDLEMLRRALTVKEVAGPLSDIVQMLLCAIFSLQEEELEEHNDSGNSVRINDNHENFYKSEGMTIGRGVQLATAASKWPQTHLSTPLSQLPMDALNFTEILRLHLLSSGCITGDNCARWRYQQRGGYCSEDDPGLHLKLKEPFIIKALSGKHITQLPLSYKIKILNCLINQVLTYATVRDLIEETQEKSRNIKLDIKLLQIAERKRGAEFLISRQKIRREAMVTMEQEKFSGEKLKDFETSVFHKLEILTKDNDNKRNEFEKKLKNLHSDYFSYQSNLGLDRAYRRYWIYESLEGVFVEHSEELSGACLHKPVIPVPALATAPPEDTLNYVQKMFENELNGGHSDKENDYQKNGSVKKLNGWPMANTAVDSKVSLIQDLLMCTADQENCPVHSSAYPKLRWSFIASSEDLQNVIDGLNKRGIRESELKQLLEQEKERISNYISKCPTSLLNPSLYPPQGRIEVQTRLTRKYVDSNLRFPPKTNVSEVLEMSLRDNVLDFEEKLYLGGLGQLQINDRTVWRDQILKRGYDQQCASLSWGLKKKVNPKDENSELVSVAYRDPGSYLNGCDDINSDLEEMNEETNGTLNSVRSLASAVLQLEQAVAHKHLKRPLGYDEKERNKEGKSYEYDVLKKWESALMNTTSFAQVLLHLITLENSIIWSRSILNANCRICRKKSDDENMLLCDSCNKGHHIYCLKPKLTKIPKGDWFCNQCKPKEKTPQKKNRKVFREEEDSGDDLDDSKSGTSSSTTAICFACKSSKGGSLVRCSECEKRWHSDCLPRPQQRKGGFVCVSCSKISKQDREWDPRVRRCAADAMNNIDHYKKMLKRTPQQYSESESSDEPLIVKARKKRISKASSPESESPVSSRPKRARRSVVTTNGYNSDSDEPIASLKSQRTRDSSNSEKIESNVNRKSARNSDSKLSKRNSTPLVNGHSEGTHRRTRRSEPVTHPSYLEELLHDVMRHKDSWPFNAPVTLEEVPDYFEIIITPMDFGTIKNNLESNKYSNDEEFMIDAAQVFKNCYSYNQDDDVVAKAGIRLQKYFEKRCKELNIVSLPMDVESEEPEAKKSKTEN